MKEAKLLGTYITDDLKWDKNTSEIIKKGFRRMQILNKSAKFTSNIHDLKKIYMTYIRSILEQSAVVWHSRLTKKNTNDLERVQKVAVRIILGKNYKSYKDGLSHLRLEKLEKRRQNLCLTFAKNCLKNSKVKNLFPRKTNLHIMNKRKKTIFKKKKFKGTRYQKSAIPYMTKLLNKYYIEKSEAISS